MSATSRSKTASTASPARSVRLRRFTRATRAVCDADSRQAVFNAVVVGAHEILAGTAAVLLMRHNDKLKAVASSGIDISGDIWQVLPTDRSLPSMLTAHLGQNTISAPMITGDLLEGMLVVRYGSEDPAEEDEILLAALLDHSTVALNQARKNELDPQRVRTLLAPLESPDRQQVVMSTMAHDLRSPLLGLRMGFDLLETSLESLDEEQTELLAHMRAARNRLQSIAENLLELNRMQAGSANFECRMEKLQPILKAAFNGISEEVKVKKLQLQLPPETPLRVCAEDTRLRQILYNLLSNAVKFSAEGDTVTVKIEEDEVNQLCHVHVQDQALGIPSSELEKVFTPFYYVGADKRRKGTGVGLGLTLAREMARKMGGDVTVKSREGIGSTFTVTLHTTVQ